MKIYIDLVLFINFGLDFLLLLSVAIILKRKIKMYNILLGSFIGSLSILLLFININSIQLFLIKVITSIFMILISFGYKNIKYFLKNFIFLYINSILLGGFMYFINNQFSYKNNGIVFYNNGLSINLIFLIIASPIIIYIYIKQIKTLKTNYNSYYQIDIYLNDDIINCTAFLDTGNKLKSPYSNKPIIIINESVLKKYSIPPPTFVPINTVTGSYLMQTFKVNKIEIKGIGFLNNVIFGISKNNININGVDCILNLELLEAIK